MKTTFEFFGVLRYAAGQKQVVVDVPDGATVGEAVDCLARTASSELGRFLVAPDGSKQVSLIVGGKKIAPDDRLAAGDVVKVLLAPGGG
jgi:molybdopterin converting factor small subunit